MKDIVIQDEWKEALKGYFESDSFKKLRAFVREEYHTTKVFPEPKNLFKAFDLTPFSQVKVVLLGQDPYHGDGQATGLSFSVHKVHHFLRHLRISIKKLKTICV
jgi:uracil-DNA glycosylase